MNKLLLIIFSSCVLPSILAMEIVPSNQALDFYHNLIQQEHQRFDVSIQTLNTALSHASNRGLKFQRKCILQYEHQSNDTQARLHNELSDTIKQGLDFHQQFILHQKDKENDIILEVVKNVPNKNTNINTIANENNSRIAMEINNPSAHVPMNEECDCLFCSSASLISEEIIWLKHKMHNGYTWCVDNPKKTIAITLGLGVVIGYCAVKLWNNSSSSDSMPSDTSHSTPYSNVVEKPAPPTTIGATNVAPQAEKPTTPLTATISISGGKLSKEDKKIENWMNKKLAEGKDPSWVSKQAMKKW